MHQPLDARFDFHERAVIGDVGDLAESAGVGRVTARDVFPRIFAQLLETQRNTVALAVVLQHADLQFVADIDHFGRMTDAFPGHVGDVQQAVNAAQIDECAVIGEVLDHTGDDGAFGQAFQHLLAFGAVFGFNHGTARNNDVVALAVELDDFEFQFLAFQVTGIAHGAHIHQGSGQEGAHFADIDREAAFDFAADTAGDDFAGVHDGFQFVPDQRFFRLVTGKDGFAETVLDGFQRDLDDVAHGDFDFALFVAELIDVDDAFRLQADVDDDDVGADFFNGAGNDGAGFKVVKGCLALLKQFCK